MMTGILWCVNCDPEVKGAIFDSSFNSTLFSVLAAFGVLALAVAILIILYARSYNGRLESNPLSPVPMLLACVTLGIGIGGFIDGIIFHQILQWHQMLSNQLPVTTLTTKSVNMFWDGLFHAFTLLVVIIGVVLLWKAMRARTVDTSPRIFGGGMLIGWGMFNIVEGILDHHILKLHNVREITENPNRWNIGFLMVSVAILVFGIIIVTSRRDISRNSLRNTLSIFFP